MGLLSDWTSVGSDYMLQDGQQVRVSATYWAVPFCNPADSEFTDALAGSVPMSVARIDHSGLTALTGGPDGIQVYGTVAGAIPVSVFSNTVLSAFMGLNNSRTVPVSGYSVASIEVLDSAAPGDSGGLLGGLLNPNGTGGSLFSFGGAIGLVLALAIAVVLFVKFK